MKAKAALTLSILAAALAGCAGNEPNVSSTSGLDKRGEPVVRQLPYKPGTGVVQSWSQAPSPAAGASGRVDPASGTLRMAVKMDDGTVQYVDTDSRDFPVGTRVRLTEDKMITRP
jgi:outer membrane lipoprotein SlyB